MGGGISDEGQRAKRLSRTTELEWAHTVHAHDLCSVSGTGQRYARGPAVKSGGPPHAPTFTVRL